MSLSNYTTAELLSEIERRLKASQPGALVQEAQEILATGWKADTLYNPDNAIGLLQTIVQDGMTEEDLSDRQHRFLLSIRSHFKSWTGARRHRAA